MVCREGRWRGYMAGRGLRDLMQREDGIVDTQVEGTSVVSSIRLVNSLSTSFASFINAISSISYSITDLGNAQLRPYQHHSNGQRPSQPASSKHLAQHLGCPLAVRSISESATILGEPARLGASSWRMWWNWGSSKAMSTRLSPPAR